jgi:hypothetical protein
MAEPVGNHEAWMAELLDGAEVLWQERPDPELLIAGRVRAARPILVGAIAACAAAILFVALCIYLTVTLPSVGPIRDIADVVNIVFAVVFSIWKPLGVVALAVAAVTAFLAVRRRARRNADRVAYILTTEDVVVLEGRGASRYALDSIFAVDWLPGKYGPARGQVIVKIRPTVEDESQPLNTGRTVRLYGVRDPARICRLIESAVAGGATRPPEGGTEPR